ncbi:TetR family transcriptional regulator [Actinoplanes cyaneus]|uniref:TetR family transcriptional regulator n=1 Tax=Actinoplanes cyaneus TaxID=52696 RepID=A0A919MAD7_9ACTN|nr:TetR/AcrR family transcriptional regulator [Actinoplanes cyaneus]MCW2143086.1 transcriptional regulator, TetR family [Actinoplanes cyaneus]GID70418.1 TetR family transcriptional regulator [Actinoplanes cyaneus]
MPATHGRTGRPPVTSRPEILAAARRLIDADGWEKVTVRRLAAELGIGATTLYHHVRDKDELLVLVLSEYARQVPLPVLPEDPRERIVVAATTIRQALAGWPWAAAEFTTDGLLGRLGGPAVQLVEVIVGAAVECGCTPERAVHVFRSLWYYTVGEILVRIRSRARPPVVFAPADTPHLSAIGERWPALAAQDTYEMGLRALISGLLPE